MWCDVADDTSPTLCLSLPPPSLGPDRFRLSSAWITWRSPPSLRSESLPASCRRRAVSGSPSHPPAQTGLGPPMITAWPFSQKEPFGACTACFRTPHPVTSCLRSLHPLNSLMPLPAMRSNTVVQRQAAPFHPMSAQLWNGWCNSCS